MAKFDFLLKNCIVTSTFFLKTSYVYQYFYRVWFFSLKHGATEFGN